MSSQAAVLARPFLPSEQLRQIEDALASKPHVSLFLDFDGTISPITAHPEDATLDAGIRKELIALSARPDFSIAIISGRQLDDIRARVGLDHITYAGNHGLEIEAAGHSFRNPDAENSLRELRCLHLQLQLALADFHGVEIEDKGLTLSVHYRRAQEELQGWIARTTEEVIARWKSFTARSGAKVVEARPKIEWNKGSAVNWILRQVSPADTLPIYLGDDLTDEDAFETITDGLTIKVGDCSSSAARFSLAGVPAVGKFLDWLDHAKPHASTSHSLPPGERPTLV